MATIKGLYHSYTSTSQSYSTARSITDSMDTFNKPLVAIKPDIAAEPVAEPVDVTTVVKCYTGSTAFLYYTGSTTPPYIANYRQ